MQLRDYQLETVRRTWESLATHDAVCVSMPTGAGKTITAASMICSEVARGGSAVVLTHRQELVEQMRRALQMLGCDGVQVIAGGKRIGAPSRVTIAMVQTASGVQPKTLPSATLLVVDECHHVKAKTWHALASHYKDSKIIGLTATPKRGDGSPLGDVFGKLVKVVWADQLIAAGYLVPCKIMAPNAKVGRWQKAMGEAEAYRKFSNGESCIVFCRTIKEARKITSEFQAEGIPAASIDSKSNDRAVPLAKYASGEIKVIVNVATLTEGWDAPITSACILSRSFSHIGIYLQAVGRIMRPHPGKRVAKILDIVGSSVRFGNPAGRLHESLDGEGMVPERPAQEPCQLCNYVYCDCPQSAIVAREVENIRIGISEVRADGFWEFVQRHAVNRQPASGNEAACAE